MITLTRKLMKLMKSELNKTVLARVKRAILPATELEGDGLHRLTLWAQDAEAQRCKWQILRKGWRGTKIYRVAELRIECTSVATAEVAI